MEYSETRSFRIGSKNPSTFSYTWDISIDKSLNDVSSLVVEISTKAIFDHVTREAANPSSICLTRKDVTNLPDHKISSERKGCLICCDHFRYNEVVKCLPCSHLFHTDCIMKWLCKVATCPHCRGVVKPTVFRLPGNFLKIVAKHKPADSDTEEILEVLPDISAEVELAAGALARNGNALLDQMEVGTIQHVLIDSASHQEEIRLLTEDQTVSERYEVDSLSEVRKAKLRRARYGRSFGRNSVYSRRPGPSYDRDRPSYDSDRTSYDRELDFSSLPFIRQPYDDYERATTPPPWLQRSSYHEDSSSSEYSSYSDSDEDQSDIVYTSHSSSDSESANSQDGFHYD